MNQAQHNTLGSHRIEQCDFCKESERKYGWIFNFSIIHRTKEADG